MTLADKIIRFNRSLQHSVSLPEGIEIMNPYKNEIILEISSSFYRRFYNDTKTRKLILGINPGRLGGGVTGIPFTDPVKLQERCGIKNDLKKITEPSAGFIYDMIEAFGGTDSFYSKYLIHAVCPLGFTKNGINYNYYDSKVLEKKFTPFIVASLNKIISFGVETDCCYCLGNGKNYKFLNALNETHKFFKTVIPLPHPRWIVQYRRKQYPNFIQDFVRQLS